MIRGGPTMKEAGGKKSLKSKESFSNEGEKKKKAGMPCRNQEKKEGLKKTKSFSS